MASTKIGALWRKDGPKGPFYSGVLEKKKEDGSVSVTEIVIFPNGYKEKPNHPDLVIYLSEPREPRQAPQTAPQQPEAPKVDPFFANPEVTSDGSPMPDFKAATEPQENEWGGMDTIK